MHTKTVSRPLVLAPVLWALALFPATAQEQRAKDGWDMLRQSLAEAGLRVASEGATETDSGLVVNGVTIRPARGGAVLTLPSLGIEPRALEGFAFVPLDGARLDMPRTGVVDLDLDGQILFNRSPEGLRLAPSFAQIDAHYEGPAAFGEEGTTSMRIQLDALEGDIETREAAQVALTGALQAGLVSITQTWSNDDQRSETAEIDDAVVRLRVDALDALSTAPETLAALFERGFALEMEFEASASRSSSHQVMDGEAMSFDSSAGYSDSTLTLRDGRLEGHGSGLDTVIAGSMAGGAGQITIDRMEAGFGLPLVVTDDMQDFGLTLSVEGAQASEESWLLLGARTFADETADMSLGLAAEGRWLVDPVQAEDIEIPIELGAIRLDQLSLRVGQARFEGTGRFDTDREAETMEQAMAMGEGAFTFTLRGGEALLTRLGNEGVLPADQTFLARMMLGGLARQVGEDHLESQVTIMPGGQVLVNGMPLPF